MASARSGVATRLTASSLLRVTLLDCKLCERIWSLCTSSAWRVCRARCRHFLSTLIRSIPPPCSCSALMILRTGRAVSQSTRWMRRCLGSRKTGSRAVAIRSHTHAKPAADGSSGAFMFGVRPGQPLTAPLGEQLLDLWAAELD